MWMGWAGAWRCEGLSGESCPPRCPGTCVGIEFPARRGPNSEVMNGDCLSWTPGYSLFFIIFFFWQMLAKAGTAADS